MASERSERRDILACIFITKSISKKLLIKVNIWIKKILKFHGVFTNINNVYEINEMVYFQPG